MKKLQLLTIIIVAIHAMLLILCGYSLESPVFWIALVIVLIDYWHSQRKWPLEQHWLGFGVQMFPIVLWAILIWYFHIKTSAFFVIMISGAIVSLCGSYQRDLKRRKEE